ncbi:MAG TPA: tetratricopeptide repeat protein, partial [Vicinamibacteria bacterium]|nr:tetratricopeptide repeat protein [Vicinamibacteria bacterium]
LAQALLATGKAAEAVTEARKATQDAPQSGEAFAALASAIYAAAPDKQKGWGEAINEAQQGAFVSPRHPVVQVAVGRLFEANGNLTQAEVAYRKALESDPLYVPAQLQMLQIESRKGGDPTAAIKRARELAQQLPQNMDVLLMLGKLLARAGEWEEAAVVLGKVAAAMPNSAEVQALAGTAHQYVGQSKEALAAYERAVALAPNNMEYLTTYGLLLGLNNQHKAGIAALQKVTSAPGYKDAAGWVNLGWLYRDMEPPRAAESAAAYEKALQLDAKNAPAALGLGWAQLTGEKYDAAIAAFTRAMELDKANTVGGPAPRGAGRRRGFALCPARGRRRRGSRRQARHHGAARGSLPHLGHPQRGQHGRAASGREGAGEHRPRRKPGLPAPSGHRPHQSL